MPPAESSTASSGSRKLWDSTFDIIKGALVIWMVVRHAVIIASTEDASYFARYINFLSGSFIFVMGYMIGRFAQRKFDADPGRSSRRLMARGVKILLIFTALNFLIQAGGFGNADKQQLGAAGFLVQAGDIYTGNEQIVSFLVLLPIGYLLLLAPALLQAASRGRGWAAGLVLAASLVAGVLPVVPQDSLVVKFMLAGIAAVALGQLTSPAQPALRPILRWPAAAALLAAGIWIAGPLGINSSAYTIGVALVLLALYWMASALDPRHATASWLALLGRYSLVGYILQILLIQILLRALGGERLPVGPELAAIAAATLLAVFATCAVLEWVRGRSRGIDGAYRFVFS
jgi:hypothetical protein